MHEPTASKTMYGDENVTMSSICWPCFFFDNILLEKIYGLKQGVNPCFFFCWELTHIVFSAYLLENKD